MSGYEDIPRIQPRPNRRRRIGVGVIVALVFLAISLFRSGAVFYTDFLWFQSVDLTSVWSGLLFTKVALFLVSGLLFFGLIFFNLWIVDKNAPRSVLPTEDDDIVVRWNQFVGPRRKVVRSGISLVLALFAGVSLWTSWREWMLFVHGGNFGAKDPQFDMDVGFFVFKLPFLNTMVTWVFTALVFCLIVSVAAHYLVCLLYTSDAADE